MVSFTRRITKFYTVIFGALIGILTIMSMLRSEYFLLGRDYESPEYQWDNPFIVLAFFVGVVAAVHLFLRKQRGGKKSRRERVSRNHIVPSIYIRCLSVGTASCLISFFFLLTLQSQPYMDCSALIECAIQFNRGDYSALSTPDHISYLYIYPFQIGFIAFEQLVFRSFGEGNYFAVQVINAIGVFFTTCCLYQIAGELADESKRDNVQRLAGILLIFDFPLMIDVTFVYGDVLGWTFAIAAFYCLIHWCRTSHSIEISHGANGSRMKRSLLLLLVPVLLSVGYLLKTNILIFLIAAVIILVLESLRRKQWYPLVIAALTIIMALGSMALLKHRYAALAGIEQFPEGTPSTCWIAMGMLEDQNFEDGWYNGYNVRTFEESGYDRNLADQMAKETIRERLHTFSHHPRYTAKFYLRKFISAWNDPQFDSQIKMEWGSRHVENLSGVARWMIYGNGRTVLYWMMNLLHFIILAGTLVETWRSMRRKDDEARLAAYVLLPILGGMLFHLLWETQARYMIGYYSMMFPLAANGIYHLSGYDYKHRLKESTE